MENKTKESIILKGIAQNILQMSVPTFEQANKLFKEFSLILITMEQIHSIEEQAIKRHKDLYPNGWKPIDNIGLSSPETMVTNSQEEMLNSYICQIGGCNNQAVEAEHFCNYHLNKGFKNKPFEEVKMPKSDFSQANDAETLLIDPHGFPKAISKVEYKSFKGNQLNNWLVKNGYPAKEIESYGEHFHVQISGNLD